MDYLGLLKESVPSLRLPAAPHKQAQLKTTKILILPSLKGVSFSPLSRFNFKFSDLFNGLPIGLEALLRSGLQIIIFTIVLMCSFLIIIKLLMLCISRCCLAIQDVKIMVTQRLKMINHSYPLAIPEDKSTPWAFKMRTMSKTCFLKTSLLL